MRWGKAEKAARSLRDRAAPPNIGAATQPMEPDMGERDDERDGALQLATEALAQLTMVKAICGVLAAEIARLHPSPRDKLGEILSVLQGNAEGLATIGGTERDTVAITQTVEHVAQYAEAYLARHRAPG